MQLSVPVAPGPCGQCLVSLSPASGSGPGRRPGGRCVTVASGWFFNSKSGPRHWASESFRVKLAYLCYAWSATVNGPGPRPASQPKVKMWNELHAAGVPLLQWVRTKFSLFTILLVLESLYFYCIMTMSLQYCDDTMLQLRGNENFCVFEMKTMDIMLCIYDINIWGHELQ